MPGYNTNLGFAIGGYDWEPANPTIDPSKPIYQTPRGNAGLLSDEDYDALAADFAGGLLGRGGYQVNQPAPTGGTYQGNYFVPNQTTGIYGMEGENPSNVYDEGHRGSEGLTLRDAMILRYGYPSENGTRNGRSLSGQEDVMANLWNQNKNMDGDVIGDLYAKDYGARFFGGQYQGKGDGFTGGNADFLDLEWLPGDAQQKQFLQYIDKQNAANATHRDEMGRGK